MFTVNYNGEEKEFSSREHAVKYMQRLDCGSDLWFGTSLLLITRIKQPNGLFEVTSYCYDKGPSEEIHYEKQGGEVVAVDYDPAVLKLGKGMVRISLRDEDAPTPCVGPFTKVSA